MPQTLPVGLRHGGCTFCFGVGGGRCPIGHDERADRIGHDEKPDQVGCDERADRDKQIGMTSRPDLDEMSGRRQAGVINNPKC